MAARANSSSGASPSRSSSAATVRARASAIAAPCSAIASSSDASQASSQPVVGEQLVARAHRGFVARRMVRVARLQREHQPVEEAPPVARAAGEQPVHRRCQPQHRQPFAERIDRGRRAVDRAPAAVRARPAACRCRCRCRRRAAPRPRTPPLRRLAAPFPTAPRRAGRGRASAATPLRAHWSCPRRSRRTAARSPAPGSISARRRSGNRSGRGG